MKRFSGAAIILLFVVVNTETSSQESSEEGVEFVSDLYICKHETGATNGDVDDFVDHITPTKKQAKCLHACVMEKAGILNEGKLVPAELIKKVEIGNGQLKGKDGKSLNEVIKDIAEGCKKVTDSDKCESAVKILACLNAAANKLEFCPTVI